MGRGGRGTTFLLITSIPIVVIILLLFMPIGGGDGGSSERPKVCDVKVIAQGTYNDVLFTRDISDAKLKAFQGQCREERFFDAFSVINLNVFPTTIKGELIVTNEANGQSTVKEIKVDIPEFQTSYPFSEVQTFLLRPGDYTVTWESSVPFRGSGSSLSTSITVVA